jgi:hypothetical protein
MREDSADGIGDAEAETINPESTLGAKDKEHLNNFRTPDYPGVEPVSEDPLVFTYP